MVERVFGYVIVKDQENDKLDIFVSLDNKTSFQKTNTFNFVKIAGKDIPIAFYWIVPNNTSLGSHNVYFLVKDDKGNKSNIFGPIDLEIIV